MVSSCLNVLQSCFNSPMLQMKTLNPFPNFNSPMLQMKTLNPFSNFNSPMLQMKTLNPNPNFNSPMFQMKTPNFNYLKCYSSTTSPENQFTVSYLVTNFGFSLETATKASKRVQFKDSEKPDSVIAIFRNFGFSDSQISHIVSKAPDILICNPHKRILPKFQFLLSKGASNSDIAEIVVSSPRFLSSSLENSIIPTFESVRRLFPSNDKVIQYLLKCRYFFSHYHVMKNVNLLLDHGVSDKHVRYMLRRYLVVFLNRDMTSALDIVKKMGFNDPSKFNFCLALSAKSAIPESSQWDAKVDVFKRWGWSDEMFLEAFRNLPTCMLSSKEKINNVMRFWVNEMSWNSSALVKRPEYFGYSLENRIIPRAYVVSYLISKGLIENNVEVSTPFRVSEEVFLEKYVQSFTEERHNLLKLYQEKKMDGKKIKENGEASVSY